MNPLVPPPVIVAIAGVLMWAVNRNLSIGKFESAWQGPAAGALLVAGLLLMTAAVASFISAKTTINPLRPSRASSLVTAGVFGISRNPIYLSDLVVLTALAVWFGNLANIVLLPFFVWYINRFQIIPEERALTNLFGALHHLLFKGKALAVNGEDWADLRPGSRLASLIEPEHRDPRKMVFRRKTI